MAENLNFSRLVLIAKNQLNGTLEYISDHGAVFLFTRREDALAFVGGGNYEQLFLVEPQISEMRVFVRRH
jgi:hypothetical protein